MNEPQRFTATMRVTAIQSQDFGASATMEQVMGDEIDFDPEPIQFHFTEDVNFIDVGHIVKVTIEPGA